MGIGARKGKRTRNVSTLYPLAIVLIVPAVYLLVVVYTEVMTFVESQEAEPKQEQGSKRILYGLDTTTDSHGPAPSQVKPVPDTIPEREAPLPSPQPVKSDLIIQIEEPEPSVVASSTQQEWEGEGPPEALLDGDPTTRWSSEYKDGQEVVIDLGKETILTGVRLLWETAAAKTYAVSLSSDGKVWETAEEKTGGQTGPRTDEIDLGGVQARFIRLDLLERATEWGFSLYEIEIIALAETAHNG